MWFFSPIEVNYFSWAFLLRDILFKAQLEKEFIQGNAPRSQEKGVHRRNLTNTHVRRISYLIYPHEVDEFRYPGVVSPWVIFQSDIPLPTHCQLSTKKWKSFVHLQSLPSLLPSTCQTFVKCQAFPHPCFANWGKKQKKRILGHRELAETGTNRSRRRGPREQS